MSSREYWFISDNHFGHNNILKFKDDLGNLTRPGFDDVNHMNEHMVEKWNSVVKPNDYVYFGGDFCFTNYTLHKYAPRLNGHKRLVLGNHDKLKMDEYYKYFEKIVSVRMFTEFKHAFIMSHYPIHSASLSHKYKFNVHGHVHLRSINDPKYINISVEVINYTPVNVEYIMRTYEKSTK